MKAEETIRYPVVSGMFYPDNPKDLKEIICRYLDDVNIKGIYSEVEKQTGFRNPESIRPLGIIVPHAAYIFSGRLQAISYSLIKEFPVDTFIIIGPAHQKSFRGISVSLDEAYVIPLGKVEIDREVSELLISQHKKILNEEDVHLSEHSIEVQLPFIKALFPEARIVSILLGEQTIETSKILKESLVHVFEKIQKNYFIVISTDLSHYHSRSEAVRVDNNLIEDIKAIAPEKLFTHILTKEAQACGFGGILSLLMLSRDYGMARSVILAYTNSGEVSGDHRRVVGYLSSAIY